ncbi:MAG: heme ABC transporter ATP-binding protein [Acidimicrobiia bacterium]
MTRIHSIRFKRRVRLPARRARGATLLSAHDVTVRLGKREVVRGVDLEVRAGEVLALVGPNGSGKSTLLAALCGDLEVGAGAVELDGQPLSSWTHAELAMRRAVLPQAPVVTFPFTVHQIVSMGRAPWNATELDVDDDEAVHDALVATDTLAFAHRAYAALSGGERARVMLARVLAQRSQLLVLDEPTAALDLHHQEVVLDLARARADAGDGVIVVLHDLGSAGACADRVAVLSDGRVVACGPPAGVLTPERLSEVYAHGVEVIAHPRTGALLVLPQR